MLARIEEIINAPIQDVWELISDFENLKRWHPLVERCDTVGQGVGAIRTVFFSDWWAKEQLDRLDNANYVMGYSVVDCSRAPAIGVKGEIILYAEGAEKTRIVWVSGLEQGNPYSEAVNTELANYYPTRIKHICAALRTL